MSVFTHERWEGATGYPVIVLGLAADAFERGAPPASAPLAETLTFLVTYRRDSGRERPPGTRGLHDLPALCAHAGLACLGHHRHGPAALSSFFLA